MQEWSQAQVMVAASSALNVGVTGGTGVAVGGVDGNGSVASEMVAIAVGVSAVTVGSSVAGTVGTEVPVSVAFGGVSIAS